MAKPGRPRKNNAMANLKKILGEEDGRAINMKAPNEDAMPVEFMRDMSVRERIARIRKTVDDRCKDLELIAVKDSSRAIEVHMPWLHKMTPERQVESIEQMQHYNERIIAKLIEEAACHVAISERLEVELRQARQKAFTRSMQVPQAINDLAIKLNLRGLNAGAARSLPAAAVDRLVQLINGEGDPALAEALGLTVREKSSEDEVLDRLLAEAHRMQEDVEIVPVVPTGFEGGWDYERGPLPRDYWSTVQDFRMSYEWKYRPARPGEDDAITGMILPEAHEWSKLREFNRNFGMIAMDRIRSQRMGINVIRELLSSKLGVGQDDVPLNMVKIWLFLLAGRFMKQETADALFDPGFFDGVVMPCSATGPNVVRELVKEGG